MLLLIHCLLSRPLWSYSLVLILLSSLPHVDDCKLVCWFSGCFTLIVLISYGCLSPLVGYLSPLVVPHRVTGWFVVCDCGISWSYLFSF